MPTMPAWLPVVAAALVDDRGRLLLACRPPGKPHAGLWEFPGGKVEIGETPRQALSRELREELGLEVDPQAWQAAGFADQPGERAIVLFLYTSRLWQGRPVAQEGQRWGWFSPAQAAGLPLAPPDRALLALWPH